MNRDLLLCLFYA